MRRLRSITTAKQSSTVLYGLAAPVLATILVAGALGVPVLSASAHAAHHHHHGHVSALHGEARAILRIPNHRHHVQLRRSYMLPVKVRCAISGADRGKITACRLQTTLTSDKAARTVICSLKANKTVKVRLPIANQLLRRLVKHGHTSARVRLHVHPLGNAHLTHQERRSLHTATRLILRAPHTRHRIVPPPHRRHHHTGCHHGHHHHSSNRSQSNGTRAGGHQAGPLPVTPPKAWCKEQGGLGPSDCKEHWSKHRAEHEAAEAAKRAVAGQMAKFQAWAASANLPGAATSAEAISKQVTERAGEDPHPEVSSECPEASCGVIGATQWQPSPIAVPHLATFNCQTVKPPVRNPGEVNRRWTPEEVARCEQHAPEILDGLSCPMYLLEANTTALTLESKCLDQMVRIQEIVENPTGHHNTREGFELATAGHLWGLRKQYDEAHGENATEEWLKHGRDLAAVPTLAQIEPMRVEVECRPYEPALPGETPPPPVARCVEEGGQHPWEIGSYNE